MSAKWLDELNPSQREAVTHGDGPLLIVAGAGSGKTKTLACRVAYLVSQGVAPDRILLLTFTRRAAGEMLSRAGRMIGENAAARVWGGTFHAVANRLLRIHGPAIGLPRDFTVMDDGDCGDLMNMIRSELGVAKKNKRFPRKETLVRLYSNVVNARLKLRQVLDRHFPWCLESQEDIATIFEHYNRRKSTQHLLDYDDLLLYWNELTLAPGVGETVTERFLHILVDEYQDTNVIQAELLLNMRRNNPNIMVVGDDAQSIYSFRAATVRNILDFPKQFPGTRTVTLEQNYRSIVPILAASNAVMEQARERFTKNLWSKRASDRKPVLVTCGDEREQSQVVIKHILTHLERGVALRHQAVLFRAGYHSNQLEVMLANRNIPFHKYGGLKFIEAAHVKDMLAFLRILENPYDEISWFRALQLLTGIGAKAARRIMAGLGVHREPVAGSPVPVGSPLHQLFTAMPAVPTNSVEAFSRFRQVLADCEGVHAEGTSTPNGKHPGALPLAAQVERIREFYEPICNQSFENAEVRLRDLDQLAEIARSYRSRNQFITDLTLDPPSATSDLAGAPYLDEDYLILSTIHSAKGCEWDVVHIIHVTDGNIPSDMALRDEEGIEEERRLLYVAMTRAKDALYVYAPLRYYRHGSPTADAHMYAQASRFLTPAVCAHFSQNTQQMVIGGEDGETRGAAAASRVRSTLSAYWRED